MRCLKNSQALSRCTEGQHKGKLEYVNINRRKAMKIMVGFLIKYGRIGEFCEATTYNWI